MKTVKLKDVDKSQKSRYFVDYYLPKIIVIIFISIIVIYVLTSIFRTKDSSILYVSVVDEILNVEKTVALEEKLLNEFGGNEKQTVTIDDTYYLNGGAINKIQVQIMNNVIDVIIAEETLFNTLASYGYFEELSAETIADFDNLQVNYTTGYSDEENKNNKPLPYGIYLSKDSLFYEIGAKQENLVIGVVLNSENKDNAYNLIRLMTKDE